MNTSDNTAFILKDQHHSAFSSKSQVKVPSFKVFTDQSPRISDHVEEPSRYFTPILRPQSLVGDITCQVVKPTTRHVNVVAPLQYHGRKILHPVPGFLRRHLADGNNSDNHQPRLPPKKRRYIDAGEGDGPAAKVGKGVSIDNSETTEFSHNENSPFSAYRRPTEPTTPQTNGVTIVKPSGQTLHTQNNSNVSFTSSATVVHAQIANQNDIEASDDNEVEVTDIVEIEQHGHPIARQNETSAAHAQKAYGEDSDEDNEIAEILENAGNKEYPILGYRVVMLTPGDDEDEEVDDEEEYDEYVTTEDSSDEYKNDDDYHGDDNYQGDDDYEGDDDYNYESDSQIDNIAEFIQITNKVDSRSPSEPWLPEMRDYNNSRAGSETMDDVMRSCFQPTTPEVIRPSPTRSTSDHFISPSATDSELSLSNFSPITISSSSTIGSISDFSTPATPDNTKTKDKNIKANAPMDIAEYVISTDLLEAEEGPDKSIKPLLEVTPSTSLAEFRASVLVGDKLSVRRYEEWFTKSEDEQFAEILEDFLEENEGNIVDEDKIRGMLADTRDRIAERRKATREAREAITRRGPTGGVFYDLYAIMSRCSRRRSYDGSSDTGIRLSESSSNVTEITNSVSSGSPDGELMETDDDDDINDSIEVMSIVSDGSSDGDLMETNCVDAEESSSDEDHEVEPSTSGEKLCRHISSFFGYSGCAAYISYCRQELQTYADQDFYSMFSEPESRANEDSENSSNSDLDLPALGHNDHNYCLTSYTVSSQSEDVILID